MALLEIDDLHVSFKTVDGIVRAVDGVSLSLDGGRTLGIVGESGSGKSVTAQTIIGLTRFPNATITGQIRFDGRDLVSMPTDDLRGIRGARIAMIFQDPLSSLHPFYRVGSQIVEAIRTHEDVSRGTARRRTIEALRSVGIPSPEERFSSFPHEMSGGMRQRVMIAMALALRPDILIADEPTTALDVTVQAQVLELIQALRDDFGTAVILITHDLGVVSQMADDVAVMYAGRVLEYAPREELFAAPEHPYTWGLLQSIPRLDAPRTERLSPIAGSPPSLIRVPQGCTFHPRCPYAPPPAFEVEPELKESSPGHLVRCHLPVEERKRLWQSLQHEHPALR
ncbi:MAG TPA: ABC transporter ATP-binding protein [Gaiellaceae bacterium]|nr:ABC transporter ATP-binding protein [Gaiellaceae bacterium]